MTEVASPAAVARSRTQLLDLAIEPSIAEGRLATYTATLTNRGTRPAHARLSVLPEDDRLHTLVVPTSMELEPGQSAQALVTLRPRRPQLLRGEREHEVRLRVHAPDGGEAAARRVLFVQKRVLPIRLVMLVALIFAAAAAASTVLLDRVEVPAVEGAGDVAAADRVLRAAGLRLDPRLRSRTKSSCGK